MKKTWSRIIGLLLCLCMVCAMAPAFADEALSGKVRFVTAYKANQGIGPLIEEFNKVYPNIEVEHIQIGNTDEGNIQIDTMLMAGEIDVLSSYTMPRTLGRVDMLTDLREHLAADGLDMAKEWGAEVEFEGGLYGIPFDGLNYFIAINMDKWNEAGLGELPTEWTWDEYLEASRAMTKDGVYGGSDYHGKDTFEFMVRQEKGTNAYYNEDLTATNFVSDPAWKIAIERKIKAENEEKIWKPLVEYNGDGSKSQDLFLKGEIASFVTCNVWRFIVDEENYPHDFKVGFAPYPVVEKGKPKYLSGPSLFAYACVTKNAQNFDAAYAFAKFIATEGDKYLLKAGHLPTWTGTDTDAAVTLVFGDEENANRLIDVESFKRVVLNLTGDTYMDTIVYSEIPSIMKEVIMYIVEGEMTVEEGLEEMQIRADEVIADAQ